VSKAHKEESDGSDVGLKHKDHAHAKTENPNPIRASSRESRIKLSLNISFKSETLPLAFQRSIIVFPNRYGVDLKNFFQATEHSKHTIETPNKKMGLHLDLSQIWKGHIFNVTINSESWIEQKTGIISLVGPIISKKSTNLNE
jgi:hypothetical protein